jgi:hypothetical protein
MARTQQAVPQAGAVYSLEGTLLEVCSCNVLCPCWIELVPISHQVQGGTGTLRIPGVIDAEMEPYRGPDGSVTTLRDSIFSTVPGSPAWVSKAAAPACTCRSTG